MVVQNDHKAFFPHGVTYGLDLAADLAAFDAQRGCHSPAQGHRNRIGRNLVCDWQPVESVELQFDYIGHFLEAEV